MGEGSRQLIRAQYLGLKDLIHFMIKAGASTYHLKGVINFGTTQVLTLACIVSASSYVSDDALATLADDDRLPVINAQVESDIQLNIEWTMSIAQPVWTAIASCTGSDAALIKERSILSALISAAYIIHKFQPAKDAPYSLLAGTNIEDNVVAFKNGPAPTQEWSLGWKVHKLLTIGGSQHDVIAALKLLSKAAWSSKITEQGHRCASSIMQKHPRMTPVTMQDRAMIRGSLPLLGRINVAHQISALEQRLMKIGRRKIACITGRQMYVRSLNK